MCVDLAVFRARIGLFCAALKCKTCVKTCSDGSKKVLFYFGLVCSVLLLVGNVEMNPGPGRTLEDIWNKLDSEFASVRSEVKDVKSTLDQVSVEVTSLKNKVSKLSEECDLLRSKNEVLENKLDKLENQSRRSNLVFYNVQDDGKETWEQSEAIIRDIVKNKMGVDLQSSDIERAHRLGIRTGVKDRPIIVKFSEYKKKDEILRNTRSLSGLAIGISEDFSERVRAIRSELKAYLIEAKKQNKRAQLRFDKLVIEGRYHTLADLKRGTSQSLEVGAVGLDQSFYGEGSGHGHARDLEAEKEDARKGGATQQPGLRGWLNQGDPRQTRSKSKATAGDGR